MRQLQDLFAELVDMASMWDRRDIPGSVARIKEQRANETPEETKRRKQRHLRNRRRDNKSGPLLELDIKDIVMKVKSWGK